MWASKDKKEWEWGQEVKLRWILEGQGVRYLGIQIGFRLPTEANFEKLIIKGKMIAWGNCNLFHRQNSGCQPNIAFLNVVPGGLLEPQSKDVQADQRNGTELHLGGQGLQHTGHGQMGFSYTPLV